MPIIRRPIARAVVVGGAIHHANKSGYRQAQHEQAMQQQAYAAGQASAQQQQQQQAPPPQQQPQYAPPPPQPQYAPAPPVATAVAAAPAPRHAESSVFSTVTISTTSRERAEDMATKLVFNKLAGSVSILQGVKSFYVYKGEVRHDDEVILLCRTRTALVDELTLFVQRQSERGEIPEITAMPVIGGNPDYQSFLLEGTKHG